LSGIRNLLLHRASTAIQASILSDAVAVELHLNDRLFEQGGPAGHVWFIESGMVSAVGVVDGEDHVEVGLIGYEGLAGLSTALGASRMATAGVVQQAGAALRLKAKDYELGALMKRYAESMIIQISQTAACNARHDIHQRLARWLLVSFDRSDGNQLEFTHEFLAWMLGVRRAGVTEALHVLEGEHAIRASRKRIALRDRSQLERLSCSCYRDALERTRAVFESEPSGFGTNDYNKTSFGAGTASHAPLLSSHRYREGSDPR
jgi:CRP-like cAMP-binding protein